MREVGQKRVDKCIKSGECPKWTNINLKKTDYINFNIYYNFLNTNFILLNINFSLIL